MTALVQASGTHGTESIPVTRRRAYPSWWTRECNMKYGFVTESRRDVIVEARINMRVPYSPRRPRTLGIRIYVDDEGLAIPAESHVVIART
jgi:hypothetical protein